MTYKKFITLLITCTLLIGSIAIPTNAKYFTDVPSDYWALEPINFVTERGYIDTYGSTFDKFGNLTRAVAAEMMYRYAGSPSITVTSSNEPFSDVSTSATYRKAVAWLYSKGIMNGTSSTTFGPSEPIHRQDIAVVLYRYARYYGKNITVTSAMIDSFESVGYVDEYDIADYAWFAVVWAYNKGIMTGKTATTLAPESDVDRQTGATVLMRYGMKIDGVRRTKDRFSFVNDYPAFTSNNYYVSNTHMQIMYDRLVAAGTEEFYRDVEDYTREAWGGSCFGMSMNVILNKLGKLNTSGNCSGYSVTNLYNLDPPSLNSNVESMINYYQVLYEVDEIEYWFNGNYAYASNPSNFQNCLRNIPKAIDDSGCLCFGFMYDYYVNGTLNEGYHAIVLYDYVKNSDGSYTISACDPNDESINTTENTYVTISSDFSTCTVDGIVAKYVNYPRTTGFTTYDIFNKYDLDSAYNNFSTNRSVLTSNESRDTTFITIEPQEGLVIENSSGERTVYTNGDFIGNMEVISCFPTFRKHNGKVLKRIEVANDDSYDIYTVGDSTYVSIITESGYSKVVGEKIGQISINSLNEVYVNGNGKFNYNITISDNTSDESCVFLEEDATAPVSVVKYKDSWELK